MVNDVVLSSSGASIIDRSIDPEKKKYFKIQANHKATPGSHYTQDTVKRKRVDQEVGVHPFQGLL